MKAYGRKRGLRSASSPSKAESPFTSSKRTREKRVKQKRLEDEQSFRTLVMTDTKVAQKQYISSLVQPTARLVSSNGLKVDDIVDDFAVIGEGLGPPSPFKIYSVGPTQDNVSEIRQLRVDNLKQPSNSVLLMQALTQKPHPCILSLKQELNLSLTLCPFALSDPVGSKHVGTMDSPTQKIVQVLISRGADVNYMDPDGQTPLLIAIQYKNSEKLVKNLLDLGALAQGVFDELSYVDIAMRLGNANVVQQLLMKGGLPSKNLSSDTTPSILQFAKAHNFYSTALKYMVTAFVKAGVTHDMDALDAIVSHGIPIDLKDRNGQTILYRAVKNRVSFNFVNFILGFNANPNSLDKTGTPMCVYPLLRNSNEAVKVIQALADHGLDVDVTVPGEDNNQTLLEFAHCSAILPQSIDILEKVKSRGSTSLTKRFAHSNIKRRSYDHFGMEDQAENVSHSPISSQQSSSSIELTSTTSLADSISHTKESPIKRKRNDRHETAQIKTRLLRPLNSRVYKNRRLE